MGTPGFVPGPSAEAQPGRGRTWLILLVSFAVQLVVVLAVGNTVVVRNALEFRNDHDDTLGAFGTLPGVYAWRLTPPNGDYLNAYPASLFGLLAFFVVAALLTLALVRGPITFWRAFVAVWLAVIVGTLAGGMVRRGVIDDIGQYRPGGKATGVLFQGTGYEVVAGAITGLLAALVAAIVAVVSRRPAEAVVPFAAPEPAPYVEPPAPPPWHGDDVRPPEAAPPSFRKPETDDTQATTQFAAVPTPPVSAGDDATTRLRREDVGQYGPPTVVHRDAEPAEQPAEQPAVKPVEEQPDPSEVEPVEAPEAAEPPVDQRTTQFPAQRPRAADGTEQAQPTQAMRSFPRPPDDEDLGHQPDDD